MSGVTAAERGLASCHTCLKLVPLEALAQNHHCPRCGSVVHLRSPDSVQRTLALLITAAILYVPANVLPIMYTDQLGRSVASTILGGVVTLVELGSFPIAAVIFIASVLVPLGKLVVMFYLCIWMRSDHPDAARQRTLLYRATEFVGKWSMIDVFVVAILVGLVHLTGLLEFRPGPAAFAFAGVVILTMIAAEGFDQRLLWDVSKQRGD